MAYLLYDGIGGYHILARKGAKQFFVSREYSRAQLLAGMQ